MTLCAIQVKEIKLEFTSVKRPFSRRQRTHVVARHLKRIIRNDSSGKVSLLTHGVNANLALSISFTLENELPLQYIEHKVLLNPIYPRSKLLNLYSICWNWKLFRLPACACGSFPSKRVGGKHCKAALQVADWRRLRCLKFKHKQKEDFKSYTHLRTSCSWSQGVVIFSLRN